MNATSDCPAGNVDDPWACSYEIGRGAALRSATRFDFATVSSAWTAVTRSDVLSQLDRVGALPQDVICRQAISDVQNHSGPLDGEYPGDLMQGLHAAAAPADSDADGMPDAWERARGLDPNNAIDQNAIMSSGYSAIEDYLNDSAAAIASE
jgi:hypothetical protein